jgi:23S rRNA pseudouridine2605 synthase
MVLDEGKNRQIRRMLNAQGVGVLRLVRVAIGSLVLGDLPKGAFRHLSNAERDSLGK